LSDFPHKRIVNEMIGEESERVLRKKTSRKVSEPVLKVTDLNRRGVLKGINFEMHRGEILGVWGLMGSGRTELLRSLLGLDPITGGEIFYRQNGKMKRITPPGLNKQVGFVTEDRRNEGLFLSMSVKVNLTIASLSNLFGKVKPFINSRTEDQITSETINKLQIKVSDSSQTVGTLSGGNQQKVVIGRWLLRDPDIYFLDEPIKGIDVGSKAEIKRLIGLLADQGKSILLVSSEIEELLGFCDRYIVMCRGQLTGEFPGDVTSVQLMDAATSISRANREGSK
jgi:ABC-type sugar transport system ATPase subunit